MSETDDAENLKLGGNIELSGFKEVDPRSMIILKKIIGNYVRKFSDKHKEFNGIKITLKEINKKKGKEQFELSSNLYLGGKALAAENIGWNIFEAVDTLLKKHEKELERL